MATEELTAKLDFVNDKIGKKLEQINNEANRRGVLYSGITVPDKVEAVSNIIDTEMKTILSDHNSKKDRAAMSDFLMLQKKNLYESFKINSFSERPYEKLERTFNNLSAIIDYSAENSAASKKRDALRFWLPLIVSLIAVAVSIIFGIFSLIQD